MWEAVSGEYSFVDIAVLADDNYFFIPPPPSGETEWLNKLFLTLNPTLLNICAKVISLVCGLKILFSKNVKQI